ncbi:MAG: 30S ribosomal protein S1 [Desulfamplus sp.]|nr:30S ribosomal protein S1 [Desulfamplus sp.]
MAEMFENDEPQNEESFADLLDSYDAEDGNDIRQGDKIYGTIISIGKSSVYVSTGSKSDGVVEKAELLDENGQLPYKVGDKLNLYVVSLNESEIILSRALSGAGYAALLEDAAANHTPVEGKVSGIIKGGFSVDIMGKRAFCPVSQIDVKYVENQEEYLGKTLSFLITRFAEGGKNIVLSRRDLMSRDIQESRDSYLKTISEGDIVQGRVIKIMPYGAFIELAPGVEGMAHISELSWSRVEKTDEALVQDELVSVKILKIEKKEGGRNRDDSDVSKISLSIRQTTQDPWERAEQTFSVGQQVTGKVVRLAPFGAFIEIAPGVDGLVHLSEMSHTKRVLKADDMLEQGQMVQVIIKEIDLNNKRISLSMKDAHGDPWNGAESRYPAGTVVEGKVEKREKFGLFVNLEPGVTGLLPASVISKASEPSNYERLKPGDMVNVMIAEISEESRRISLAPPDAKEGNDWRKFAANENKSQSIGSMGALLMEAMNKK